MKRKILLGFCGMPRTYQKCSENIISNILLNNKDQFDFYIYVNCEYDEFFYENFNKLYNSFNIVKISYYNKNIEDKTEVGSKLFRHRCNLIFDSLEHEYDLYIFLRLDIKINNPIKLEDFLSENKNYFCFITGGNIVYHRLDHLYDWDYCWIGNFTSMKLWLKYYTTKEKITYKNIKDITDRIVFRGLYFKKIINEEIDYLEDHWVNKYFKIFYSMIQKNCEFITKEEEGIFFNIIR